MKFKFENLGALTKKTEIELADLTILCGANNTGKTYATRAIYGFLKTWENNIDFKIDELYSKQKSQLVKKNPEIIELFNNIVGGEYKIENDQISFVSEQNNKHIPLYLSSAMVVSQVELNFYLKCLAKKGDILLFDEPEQNLHPANQRKIARLFVRLIKAGIKVFITTHSDYLIKELNNLIVLNNEFGDKNEIMKKYHYSESEILDKSLVKTYIAEKHSLISADIDDMGIEVTHFDKEIDEMNQIYDDMLFAMEA